MDDKVITLDIENFRLPNNYIRTFPKPPKKPRKPRLSGNFLKGPIPITWLMKACALPGKAFQVGIVLWYLCGLQELAAKQPHRRPLPELSKLQAQRSLYGYSYRRHPRRPGPQSDPSGRASDHKDRSGPREALRSREAHRR